MKVFYVYLNTARLDICLLMYLNEDRRVKITEPSSSYFPLPNQLLHPLPQLGQVLLGLLLLRPHGPAAYPYVRDHLYGRGYKQGVHAVGGQLGQGRLHCRKQGSHVTIMQEDLQGDLQLVPAHMLVNTWSHPALHTSQGLAGWR